MEMVSDTPDDERLKTLFEEIKQELSLPSLNSDYRTLGLWPHYLEAAWQQLRPAIRGDDYIESADRLRSKARELATELPHAIPLSRTRVEESAEDAEEVATLIASFEQLLPSLILNIALFQLDWKPMDVLARSPFPADSRALSRELAGVV